MKQNFSTSLASMTSFFRRTLFFVLLFGGVCNVWGYDNLPASLSFNWTQYASSPETTSLGGGNSGSDKIIQDGYFCWSGIGENNLKNNNGFCIFKGDDVIEVAESRVKYHMLAGTYDVTITCKCKEKKLLYTPIVMAATNTWDGTYLTQPTTYKSYDSETTWQETVQMSVAEDGDLV